MDGGIPLRDSASCLSTATTPLATSPSSGTTLMGYWDILEIKYRMKYYIGQAVEEI
jgi:hypothetical protein